MNRANYNNVGSNGNIISYSRNALMCLTNCYIVKNCAVFAYGSTSMDYNCAKMY